MQNNELISYAILDVNYKNNRDYLSNFEPFLLEIIRSDNPDFIASKDLQKGVLEKFSLNIPENVIKTICKNLEEKGFLERVVIKGVNGKYNYVPVIKKIDDLEFEDTSEEISSSFKNLIKEFQFFVKNHYDEELDKKKAINMFEAFIKKNNVSLVSKKTKTENKGNKDLFLVGSFVEEIYLNNKNSYQKFLNIVKGNMLSEALYYTGAKNFKSKFKDTLFYFDTSFLMYALGYSGKKREIPCTELLDLIKKNGGKLCCFEHSITEIIGILIWSKHNLNSGKDSHNTITYFRENKIDESGIELLIHNLRNDLETKLNIKIYGNAEFDHSDYSKVINYNGLQEYLKSNINYTKEESLENDVESVASIMRLRKNKTVQSLEESDACFVTTNGKLSYLVKKFLTSENKLGIPPILTDSAVTNLVWLKNPELHPDLPSVKLISDCYAATNPSDRLWNEYIDRIDELYKSEEVLNESEIVTLRYLPNAKKILMDITMGDENAITDGCNCQGQLCTFC